MMDSDTRGDTGSLDSEASREFAARRTVIKGLVSAVPVILTVSSGEALANASNLQCIQNPPSLSPEQCVEVGSDGVWARGSRFVDDGTGTGNTVEKDCLLYADESGNIFENPGAQLNPFTVSCYGSFT